MSEKQEHKLVSVDELLESVRRLKEKGLTPIFQESLRRVLEGVE